MLIVPMRAMYIEYQVLITNDKQMPTHRDNLVLMHASSCKEGNETFAKVLKRVSKFAEGE